MQITDQIETIQHDALEEATAMFIVQQQRGVPQVTTAVAAAMVIGQIIGSTANDAEHIERGLDHLTRVMRAVAADWSVQTNMRRN